MSTSSPADRRWRSRHLPVPLAVCAVVAVVAALVGGAAAGVAGALGAALGVTLAAVGYVLSTLAVAWADRQAPALVMPVGMMAYIMKITLIAAVLTVAALLDWPGVVPMAWGLVAGVVAWITAHIWWLTRGRRVSSAIPR